MLGEIGTMGIINKMRSFSNLYFENSSGNSRKKHRFGHHGHRRQNQRSSNTLSVDGIENSQ